MTTRPAITHAYYPDFIVRDNILKIFQMNPGARLSGIAVVDHPQVSYMPSRHIVLNLMIWDGVLVGDNETGWMLVPTT